MVDFLIYPSLVNVGWLYLPLTEEFGLDERGNLTGIRESDTSSVDLTQTEGWHPVGSISTILLSFIMIVFSIVDEMTLQRLRVGELPNSADSSYETSFRRIIMVPKDSTGGDSTIGVGWESQRSINPRTSAWTSQARKTSTARSSQSGGSMTSTGGAASGEWLTNLSAEQLVECLQQTGNLAKQAEILGRLKQMKGLDWDTGLDPDSPATVRSLLKEVYQKACQSQDWFLLRYVGGLLEKIADQLATAVSSILILQKQITVGLPPKPREKVISSPLPPAQIAQLIQEACGEDNLMAMLTQVYLKFSSISIKPSSILY